MLKMEDCEEFSTLEILLLKHPGLVLSDNKTKDFCLQGLIKNNWFNIKIVCPHFPTIQSFQLQIQQSFLIHTYTSDKINIPKEWSVNQLIEYIPSLLENQTTKYSGNTPCRHEKPLQNIFSEIANLYSNSEYDIQVNEVCSRIRFSRFTNNEQHFLEVALPSLLITEHSLPSCLNFEEMLGKASSLTALVQIYCKYLQDLRPFYENFTDIDELCHVVAPTLPSTKENWRLFVLKDRVFLKLLFTDPFSHLSSMSVHIIGPTPEVTHLRRIYSDGLRDWDGELDVHKNLLRIFDLCFFPMPPSESSESSSQYCNICYCYKLDRGEIPIVSCDNPNCSLIFHAACLQEWFNTLADGKTFLEVAFGACPFCKSKLSTSFQEILE